MIPTQPTPEEQVEAQRIAWDILRETPSSKDGWYSIREASKVALAFIDLLTQQSQERAELEELRAVWATVPADLFNDTAHNERVGESWREAYIARMKEAVDAKAEFDRAVEREKSLQAVVDAANIAKLEGRFEPLHDALRALDVAPGTRSVLSKGEASGEGNESATGATTSLAASPGKGAEGDCHGNCGAEYANFNCPKCRDPEAAPIEDEEEA